MNAQGRCPLCANLIEATQGDLSEGPICCCHVGTDHAGASSTVVPMEASRE